MTERTEGGRGRPARRGCPLSSEPAVRCTGLLKVFGRLPAVNGIDLCLKEGEFLALLGPSGCGKTTTLRLIAGFEEPDAGRIEIDGRAVVDRGVFVPPELRRIGIVFQDYALFPHLDVAANVAFGLRKQAQRAEQVRATLELVGLTGLESRYPHELSGGQQQRVALARALAPRPAVVLLDEPFSNLDAALRARVRAEVRDILRRAGATTIFVTHDQAEALSLADRVVVMWAGSILQVGTPLEVYRAPATREVAVFVGDMDSLPGTAEGRTATCELGRIELQHPMQGEVDVFFRSEMVALEPDPVATAEVLFTEFYGHDQRLTVRLESGRLLHARLQDERTLSPGQRVRVGVHGPAAAFPAEAERPVAGVDRA